MISLLITVVGLIFIGCGAWGIIACLTSIFKKLDCNLIIPLGLEISGIILIAIH